MLRNGKIHHDNRIIIPIGVMLAMLCDGWDARGRGLTGKDGGRGGRGRAAALIPAGTGLGFAVPSVIVVLLEAIPADQAGMAAGLLNSSRQVGGTLAVAVFGALIAHRTSFLPGMRASVLIAVVVLAMAAAAAMTLPRRSSPARRENELTGLGR